MRASDISARPICCLLTLALLASSACGGAQRRPEAARRPIDRLRARAAEQPNEGPLAVELALGEHLYDGGEPERARVAVQRAEQLTQGNLSLRFIAAEQHVLEGEPQQALTDYLALLEQAASASEPLAPLYAEVALQSLADMNDATDDYRPRLHEALTKLRDRADTLGIQLAHQVRMGLMTHATQAGEVDAAGQLAHQAGCVQRVDVAGPFGPRELLGFDQPLPAEAAGPLAPEHDLGPGRKVRPLRTLETRRCAFGLGRGAHDALPGTSVLRAELAIGQDRAGTHALRIESPNSYAVYVDGQARARVDLRGQQPSGVRYLPLELAAGKHELKIKLSSRHPNPAISIALIKADAAAIERTSLPAPKNELERYLIAKVALGRGDAVRARELTRKLGQATPSAHWLVLEAATALADPLKTAELRRDRARELLLRAGAQNPRAWYPSVGVARLASAEGRAKEAIEALREAAAKWPEASSIRTSLVDHLRDSGYVEEADRVVAELERQLPHACAVVNLSLASARARGRLPEVLRSSERAMACDATSSARLAAFKAQHKYEEAAAELLRLTALGEPLDEAQQLETSIERARLLGDRTAERTLREQRGSLWSDRPEPVLDRVDLLLADGQKKAAIELLAKAIAAEPGDLYELRRNEDALSPDELFKGFRKPGDQVIRAFEPRKDDYQEPQVLVLDYTVQRIFEDGSSVSLTHNIIRVQSQEAVDENGEFSVPEGARLLSLHTIKANGTRLEPDVIAGKESWSLPSLSPGDYVEFEYVRGESPSAGFPGGYLGDRFYFKSFEIPFDQSELVVLLPENMEPVLDPRGPLPELVKESRAGLKVLRWTAKQSHALSPEPSSVATREFLPSINLGVKVSWQAYVESLRDLLVDKDVFDPAAQEFVAELLGKDAQASSAVRAEILYRWVTEQIEVTNDVFGSAAAMLSARTGSRERVLKYMLALDGIESELVLARGIEADHSAAALPDPETFGHLLLRVKTERGPVLLYAGARHAPFGYLPPQVRGERALVVNARAEQIETPPDDLARELRTVELDVTLDAQGQAKLHVRETHRGASAVEWRNDLDAIPEAELENRFEQSYAASVLPGARLGKLTIEARDQPEQPLVLDYEVEVSDLGQRSGLQQRIAGLFPSSLAPRYARQGARSTTEIVAPQQSVDVHTRIALPKGARVVTMPKGGTLGHPSQASFASHAETQPERVELHRSVRLPIARITPADYASFAAFCRGVDAVEASELVIELPTAK
jgi:cellulose synthase operon protein C